ncbi:MAG: thioredoxin family protein [Promethearchaeota archaeon]
MAYPIILFFSSPYCAPCKQVHQMLDEINLSLFGNKLRIRPINIAEDVETARKHQILSVPTIICGSVRLSVIIDKRELTDAILQGFLSSISVFDDEDETVDGIPVSG